MTIHSIVSGLDYREDGDAEDIEQKMGDALAAVAGLPREVIEAQNAMPIIRVRAPRQTAAEREQAAITKAEAKLESLRAKERVRRLREAHGHVEQAMVYLQGGDAIVRMAAGGGCEDFDIRDVLIDIRAALREEIGE